MKMEIEDLDPIFQKTLKLDIGSGIFERKDWTWTTVDKYVRADIQAEMWALPFADDSVDAIWSSHALEHVTRAMALVTLREWLRVLKPGGECTVQVPDLDYAARLWLRDGFTALGVLFGGQEHEGEFHKNGWFLDGLVDDIQGVGFTVTDASAPYTPEYTQQSLRVVATK